MPFEAAAKELYPLSSSIFPGESGRQSTLPERKHYFAGAGAEDHAELMKIRSLRHLAEGQTIHLNPEGKEGFFLLHAGFVKLIWHQGNETEIVRIVGANDMVGYGRWFNPTGRYEMVALSTVVASYFRRDDFSALQDRSPYLSSEVVRWLADVLAWQEQRLKSLRGHTAKQRVAGTLNLLRKRFGRSIGCGDSLVSLPIDRKTLADLANVAVEVLSRVISELEAEGVVTRQGRVIIVTDTVALERASDR